MSIFIDKEMRALIPPLSDEELEQLEENILAEGIRDPLVTWPQPDGREMLIDGHNRFDIACRNSGIPFQVKRMDFQNKDEAKIWMIQNQLGRRNIDKWTRFDMVKELELLEKENAKKRMSDGAKGVPTLAQAEKGKTRDKMADMIGVSHGTYDKMKAIDEKATDRTKQLVREGKLSINQAYNSVHPKQPDPVKQAKEEHEAFQQEKLEGTVDLQSVRKDKDNQTIIQTALMQEVLRLVNDIDKFGMTHTADELRSISSMVRPGEKTMYSTRISSCQLVLEKIKNALVGGI